MASHLSLKAAQADGFYRPPTWKPEHGSLDRSQGSRGSLGHRANKLHLGILVVRFELPHNCWCMGCGCHIAQGVRFNAEKKKVGMFMSSAIHEFRMNCRNCSHPFVIRNDPEAGDYVFASGIRRKAVSAEDAVDPATVVEVAAARDRSGRRLGETKLEGMEKLEADALRAEKADAAAARLKSMRSQAERARAAEPAANRAARLAVRKRAAEASHTGESSDGDEVGESGRRDGAERKAPKRAAVLSRRVLKQAASTHTIRVHRAGEADEERKPAWAGLLKAKRTPAVASAAGCSTLAGYRSDSDE